MKTSADFGKAYQEITGEVKQTIIDLLENQQKVSSLEIDEETGFNHAIGYYSDMNGWIEQNIAKVETAPNGEIVLINEYGEELFNENIPDSEWAVVLECIEAQLVKVNNIDTYIQEHNERVVEETGFGYGIITDMDDDSHWATLVRDCGVEQIFNAVSYGQEYGQFSYADEYFYYDTETKSIFSFNTLADIKKHFAVQND